VFTSERAFESALDELALHGGRSRVVTESLPAGLAPVPGAILDSDEAHCDPHRFVQAVGRTAMEKGVAVRTGVEVLELRRRGRRIESLRTTAGELRTGEVVLA